MFNIFCPIIIKFHLRVLHINYAILSLCDVLVYINKINVLV
jgi:hypothetical protein